MSLYCHNAVLSDDKDKFQVSETNHVIMGSDSSVTAAIVFNNFDAYGFIVWRAKATMGLWAFLQPINVAT